VPGGSALGLTVVRPGPRQAVAPAVPDARLVGGAGTPPAPLIGRASGSGH